jgi:phage minor structural protein
MLILYDKDHNKIAGLTNYKEYNLEREINSEDTLSFQYPSNDFDNRLLEQECYIRTKENEYIIKEVNYEDDDWVSYVCKINIEDIKGQNVDHFEVDSESCTDAVNLALSGTGWTVGACDVSRIRPVSKSKCTAYDVLQEIQSAYDCEISYDSINKKAYIYNEMGNDRGAYFAEQLNLKSLEVQGNSYDYVTMLVPIGKDGLDITSVNNGKNYVENYQYSSKKLIGYWEDNRYTDPSALMEDAAIQLEYLSKPLKSYKVDLVDLAKAIDAENYDTYKLIDYSLGDAVTILSKEKNVKEKQRIVKMTIYPDEPERNEVELSNKSPSLEYLQIKFEDTSDTVDSITTSDGMIDGSKVDSIDWDKIDHIHVKIADVENLSATIANIGTLTATKANITDLDTTNATIKNLQSDKANVGDLTASNARISTLEVGAESVNTLLAGNLSASNMQAGFITANSGLIANGAIASAQIINLDVSKLNAGNISTDKFVVTSDSGNLKIQSNVMKVWDTTGKERVSLGLNGTDYNLLVRGSDGTTVLFGTTGVTNAGITAGAVDDSKVSSNANIQGSKLDIDSVFSSMNGSSSSLKATKVNLDDQGQTLQVAFTNLSNTVTSTSNTVSSQGTSLSVVQGQINSKIWQQDITTAVNNIQIGGRNYIPDSGFELGTASVYYTNTSHINPVGNNSLLALGLAGVTGTDRYAELRFTRPPVGTYIMSFDIKADSSGQTLFGQPIIQEFGNSYRGFGGSSVSNPIPTTWTRYSFVVIIPTDCTTTQLRFIMRPNTNVNNGTVYYDNLKLEAGNKATDWTPAPEDTQLQITTINSNYSSLNQTVNSISSAVGSLQTTTSSLGTRVSSTESSINQLNSSITTKVTQTDINNSINAVQVGGRNLVLNSNFSNLTTNWVNLNSTNIVADSIYGNMAHFNLVNSQASPCQNLSNVISGTYTMSAIVKTSNYSNVAGIGFVFFYTNGTYTDYTWGAGRTVTALTNSYFKYTITGSSDNTRTISSVQIRIWSNSTAETVEYWVGNIKFEAGNKCTDWTPAPEDVQSKICGLTFINLVGCVSNGNNLTSNNSNAGWGNSGCSSAETFINGNYLECTIASNYSSVMTGLSHSDTNENYTSINYAWYTDSANLQIYENGTQVKNFGAFTVGEILRISVENNQINYYRNGVLAYTSTQTPTLPLVLDTAFYNAGSGVNNINKGTMLSGIVSRLSTAESSITQLSNQINLRVTTDTYNSGMASANSNAKSYANTAQSNAISGANSHTDSQISILQGQINSKVDVNGVQSTITQSPSQVQVAFNNINSSIVKIDKMGFTVANGYFNVVQGTDKIFTFDEDGLKNTGVEMGSRVRTNIPYIDFHSSGFDNDYDSRISGDGGNSYTGKGNLSVDADAFWMNVNKANYHGREVMGGDNGTYAIGIVQGSTNYLQICNNSGAWGASIWASDISMKTNVQDSLEDALPCINNIKHRMFNWKQDGRLQKLGYVAQELNEINSDFVMKIPQENGYVRMQPNETTIIPYLSKAIQELSKEINDLKEEMEKLKGNSLIGQ